MPRRNCMQEFKIYIGCALTLAPPVFQGEVDHLKNKLKTTPNIEVLDFFGLGSGTPREVYEHDMECVEQADLMVAICDYPGIGLGWEMGTRVRQLQKPILVLAHTESHITRLIQDPGVPNYTILRYENLLLEGFEIIMQKVRELRPSIAS